MARHVGPGLTGARADRRAHGHDLDTATGSPGSLLRCRGAFGVGDHHRCPTVAQQVGDLRCDETEVQGDGDGPQPHDPPERFDVLRPIRHEHRHTRAHAYAYAQA